MQMYLEENVMSQFNPLDTALSVPLAKKFDSPKYSFEHYQPSESKQANNHVVVSWLLGKSYNSFNLLEKYFLTSLLIDNSSSPLRQALETSDLGSLHLLLWALNRAIKSLSLRLDLRASCQIKLKILKS